MAAPRPVRRFALSHAARRLLGVAVRAWPSPVTWKRPKHRRTFEELRALRLVTGALDGFTATPAGCQEVAARGIRPQAAAIERREDPDEHAARLEQEAYEGEEERQRQAELQEAQDELPPGHVLPEDLAPTPPKLTADGRLAAALAKQPARRAACPVCSAPVGRPCKRPSGYTIPGGGVHAPRVRAAQLVRP